MQDQIYQMVLAAILENPLMSYCYPDIHAHALKHTHLDENKVFSKWCS